MLDGQEKDRLKDRHATSVQESKARSSIFLEDAHPTNKRQRKRPISTLVDATSQSKRRESASIPQSTFPSALAPDQLESIAAQIEKEDLRRPQSPVASIASPVITSKKTPAKRKAPARPVKAAAHVERVEQDELEPIKQSVDVTMVSEAKVEAKGKQIRAKRRVVSLGLKALSTFTPDVEAIFKEHAMISRTPRHDRNGGFLIGLNVGTKPSAIQSEEECEKCTAQHGHLLDAWNRLEKVQARDLSRGAKSEDVGLLDGEHLKQDTCDHGEIPE